MDLVKTKLETLDESELKDWKEKRLQEVKDRSEVRSLAPTFPFQKILTKDIQKSEELGRFLDSVECNREDELSQLRREFRTE